jgi:hypothetical protein
MPPEKKMTSFFKAEMIKEFKKQGADQKKVVKEFDYQRGKSNKKVDARRTALPPGKRISKSGKVYWESRKSRSDLPGSNV